MTGDDLRRTRLDGLAVGLLVLCCVVWGLNQVAAKVALADFAPFTQAALRSIGAALLVLGWARWRGIALFDRDRTLRAGVVAGVLFAGEFACIFVGLQFTTASRMVVFIYLSPFVVALGMPLVARGERLAPSQWAGLAAAFAGVAWAFAEGFMPAALGGPRQWLGDALGLAAALLWGATTLVIRATRLSSAPPEKTLLYQLAVSGLLLALAVPLAGEGWPPVPRALSVASLGFQTVVVTFASYLTW
ncbi:MAG: DMT family transporter, partial [Aquincola sp.]|nr:DMT family transporter [Aquincola sp.]